MKTRDFDPAFGAALRSELKALADRSEHAPSHPRRPILLRPQLWVPLVVAVALVAATIGVLHLTAGRPQPAQEPTRAVVDPLSRITDPSSPYYVARSVTTLLAQRGTGSGTAAFDVPGTVSDLRVYLNCTGHAGFGVGIDRRGDSMSGGCERDTGSSYSMKVDPGRHTASVKVRAGVRWSLLVIRTPGPTIAPGSLIDPAQQVLDLRNPDAVVGDDRPLLRASGSGGGGTTSSALPDGVRRVRVLLACTPASAQTSALIDGHLMSGCQNAIAHWFDLTPTARTLTASVHAAPGTAWALLVIRAPSGGKDSPANTVLPYPATAARVLAQARGAGAEATGTFLQAHESIGITTTCRGTGWLEITTGASGTTTRGTACSPTKPNTVGFGGPGDAGGRHRWRVIPHGDINWTFRLTDD